MELVSSCNSSFGECNRDMERLLEAFGSSFSLETISSAYSQASRNVDLAGGMLYELQETTAVSGESKDDLGTTSISLSDLSSEDTPNNPYNAEANGKGLPQNNSVSGISGEEYMKSTMSTNGSPRIQSYEAHANESLTASCSKALKDDSIHADVEDFLFRMLGDGFQLDSKKIHEVLGFCGYDLEKSMDALVDLSTSTLEKSDDVVSRSTENVSSRLLRIKRLHCSSHYFTSNKCNKFTLHCIGVIYILLIIVQHDVGNVTCESFSICARYVLTFQLRLLVVWRQNFASTLDYSALAALLKLLFGQKQKSRYIF